MLEVFLDDYFRLWKTSKVMTALQIPRKKGNGSVDLEYFKERQHNTDRPRKKDERTPYERDRARILHSAAFRRLQGKTQVMGVGEGDFHRTRLTHSIECAQIGGGLSDRLEREYKGKDKYKEILDWLPCKALIEAACFAHDFGHPPFGHKGEEALHKKMIRCGGFEGNAQTLRILCRLEKYNCKNQGINPTRRLILAVLKYPIMYENFDPSDYTKTPPKCYYETEDTIVNWAFHDFLYEDISKLSEIDCNGKARHKTLDCSIMEIADDIAYGIHDIEDIVARSLVTREEFAESFTEACRNANFLRSSSNIVDDLYKNSFERKQAIGELVNNFMSEVDFDFTKCGLFEHPMLKYNVALSGNAYETLKKLKDVCFKLAISRPQSKQLERRGAHIVEEVFNVLCDEPKLINQDESDWSGDACKERRVCDYIAGMTDSYIENLYRRLFVPGFGNSADKM